MATGKKTGGRGKGTPNKATAERQAAIAASGKTPLEIMLENTRWAYAEAIQLTERLADAVITVFLSPSLKHSYSPRAKRT
jgi:hypothetical protein